MGDAAQDPLESAIALARTVPKVELHAHLNGSVRASTLIEYAAKAGVSDEELAFCRVVPGDPRPQAERWRLWPIIHRSLASLEATARIAGEMVTDYANDGCVWLEMRTTPKRFEGSTKADYLRTVCAAARAAAAAHGGITVKVLVSVNRADGVADAAEHCALAGALAAEMPDMIAGIDLSGNFHKGDWEELRPVLAAARREHGLPLAVHFAERQGEDAVGEQRSMLQLRPERLGHAAHVRPEVVAEFAESRLPVEACLTAHVSLRWAKEMAEAGSHGVALCCDNTFVFGTSLAREYGLAAHHWGWDRARLLQFARKAAELCFFGNAGEREALLQRFAP
eukprot:TRINITY_DN19917_c0_g1_i1.p1 TRINITY_DN19917_c0_g1~~TRINITY_DN19917_c0_g1_i1.p1  ORF type:complete len:362 (+),score=114.88 TRINITY_DN19917_c0_g1_i1:73-1086(+)